MQRLFSTIIFVSFAIAASAQQGSNQNVDLGWTSSVSFEGNADSSQRVLDLNSSVGYNFNQHWGADIGVPLEFVSSSSSTTATSGTGKTSSSSTSSSGSLNGIGNVFADLRFNKKNDLLNYTSTLTAAAPTGSKARGISTGRANVGWNNHVEHDFGRFTPFVEAGFANGVTDTHLYHRPFTTLGFVSQFTGGASVDLGADFSIGASLYDVLPSGQQKVYSKLVGRNGQAVGKGTHGRSYELNAETTGAASLTRDNGDSMWVEYSPRVFDFQVGYTHSVVYAMNTFAFSAGVNLQKLMKKTARY